MRLLLDVRQRRGVRGSEYAWANSLRLQATLAHARIAYEHHPELAPTTDLRQLQRTEDDRQGVGKRSRRELAAEYTRRYITEILDSADLTPIVSALPSSGIAALLCVERGHAHPEVSGPHAVQLAVEQARAAQPDLRFHIDAILGDGDLVAVAGTASRGSQPSPAAPGLIWLIRLKDGQMAEMWTYRNTANSKQQIKIKTSTGLDNCSPPARSAL